MAGDGSFEENVEIHVNSSGMAEAADEAEALEEKLHGVAAAGEEAGAGIAAGMTEAAAAEEEAAAEAGHLRDNLLEAGAAADEQAGSMAGLAAAQDAASAASKRLRDEQGRFMSAGGRTVSDPFAKAIRDRYAGAGDGIGKEREDAEKAAAEVAQLQRDIRSTGLSGAQSGLGGHQALDDMAAAIERAKAAYAEAAPVIDQSDAAISRSARDAGIAATAMGNWHAALSDIGSGGDLGTAATASRELDGALGDMTASGNDALVALGDIGGAAQDAEGGLSDLEQGAASAGSAFSGMGDALSTVQPLLMPAAWGALGAAIAGIAPAALSMGAGFGAFGALAVPALMQVKNGYESVTAAQAAYRKAQALEAQDPTKGNATAVKTDLAKLRAAYASVPADVRPAVKGIQELKTAWSGLAQSSGVTGDVLSDIPKALGDIRGLFPSISKLAQSAAPEISKLLGSLGGFEKSKGFSNFVSSLSKDLGPALSSLKPVGNAIGGLLTDLANPKFAKTGDNFISSIGTALKGITPAAMSAVTGGLHAMTGALNEIGTHGKDLTSAVDNFKQLEKLNFSNLKSGGSALNALVGPYLKLLNSIPKPSAGKGGTNPIVAGLEQAAGLFNLGPDSPVMKVINQINKTHQAQVKQQVHVKTQVTREPFTNSQLFPREHLPTYTLRPPVRVVPKVLDAGFDKIIPKLRDEANGVAPIKVSPTVEPAGTKVTPGDTKDKVQQSVSKAAQNVTVHGMTVSLAGAKLSGQQALASTMRQAGQQAGKALDTGVGSGISSGASAAAAKAKVLATDAKAALAGLPGAMHAEGVAAAQGLAAGIAAGTPAAVAAAHSMAEQVQAAAKVSLDSHSPSKKFQKIGHDTILGFILGLEGGKSAVDAAMKAVLDGPGKNSTISRTVAKLQADINDAFAHQKINAFQKFTLTQRLADDNSRLQNLVQQRTKLVNEIKAAEALARSVTQAAISGASVIGIAGNTQAGLAAADQAQNAPGTSGNPYTSIQAGMKDQLAQIRQFKADIVRLKKEGLDKTSIKQLLQAGVSGGLPVAEQILAGGAGGVKQISQLQNEINKASKDLGVTGANAAYENAANIGKALAQGLKDSLKQVNREIGQLAKSLVVSLMTALGASNKAIKDAIDKLDKELGIGGGGSGGGGAGGHKVTPPHIARHQPIVPVHPVTGGGGGGPIVTPVTHTTIVAVDGAELARTVETYHLRHGRRNPVVYPNLPGR